MKAKLKIIEIAFFRGASQPAKVEFDSDKNVTMIYGENGSGKSSVVDAFDFLCGRNFGSLRDRSGADTDFLTSILGRPEQVRVKLTAEAGSWEATFKPKSKTITVAPPKGCPDARILRRTNILQLIDAIPSKRFEALKEYVDVAPIEKCEKALGEAIRGKEGKLASFIQAYAQAQTSLFQMWQSENSPAGSAEQWAQSEASKDLARLRSEIEELERVLGLISRLQNLTSQRSNVLQAVIEAGADLTKASDEEKAEEKKLISQTPAILGLLQLARQFIAVNPDTKCPVCRQTVNAQHLSEELDKRISGMSELAEAARKTNAAKKALEIANAEASAVEKHLIELIEQVAPALASSKLSVVADASVPEEQLMRVQNLSLGRSERLEAALKLAGVLTPLQNTLQQRKEACSKTIAQNTGIATQLKQLQQNKAGQDQTAALLGRMRRGLEVIGTTRKGFIKEVLDDISAEVERLYANLHPNEDLGGIKLSLDPANFGSLYLKGDFHSAKGIPPQSIFSESHLDTLGFCVFLALAKRYKLDDTIIILDDVLTSVDAQHLDRFIALLHDEEHHFGHVIITTHYRPWCDKYRYHRAPGNKVHFLELRAWNLESGIHVQQLKLSLNELRETLTAPQFDRQSVASKAGIFLEAVLLFLARIYECRLPFTGRMSYTLGELLNCFSKKLLTALIVDRLKQDTDDTGQLQQTWVSTPLAPILTGIKQWANVRNVVGCHFNELGADCPDKEVEELGKLAVELGEILICADGGDLPSRDDSGSFHETRSKKVRLHPFAEPL
jgi:energy-coupling factor transporter ATP-binding protein EcfA2